MPTYTFQCYSCNSVFVKFMTIRERNNSENPSCPHCKSQKVSLIIQLDDPRCQ
jgi:putative FmdB family regulatory protein